jgi:MoaA/NifB/PqqE/SkfB family radical SAM enzyme
VGNVINGDVGTNVKTKSHLDYTQWRAIIKEAKELGVMGFVIAGGEPFLFPELLNLCQEFKDRLFIILTNGTSIYQEDYKILKRTTNVAVLVSLEGGYELTDLRRGAGVYDSALETLKKLSKLGVPNGISATITRMNHKYWMDEKNIDQLIDQGVRIGVFLEYIPITPAALICQNIATSQEQTGDIKDWSLKNDHMLMLTPAERLEFRTQILRYRDTKSIYIIHSPGDEEYFGGCVSAGRGFAHVTPNGDLTPCPVSDIATHNLTESTLRDALASQLFCEIRDNEHLLEVEDSPCALYAHPQEVDALAKKVGAYRSNSRL